MRFVFNHRAWEVSLTSYYREVRNYNKNQKEHKDKDRYRDLPTLWFNS